MARLTNHQRQRKLNEQVIHNSKNIYNPLLLAQLRILLQR